MISCDSGNTILNENPLNDYLKVTGFDQKKIPLINQPYYESGMRFKPKVNGNIRKLVLKFPDNQTNLRITIWDVATQTVYRTETITNLTADIETKIPINPLTLIKDKEYLLSYCSNNWYVNRNEASSDVAYPIVIKNIIITGVNYVNVQPQTQIFPTSNATNYYAGDLSFIFQVN